MKLLAIQNPLVSQEDINNIQDLLRTGEVLVGAGVQQQALYNAADYHIFKEFLSGEVRVLLDRNFLTRIVDIAKGNLVNPNDPLYKLVSAAMAFFIYCEVIVDPAVALYEYGHAKGHLQAIDDLRFFRIADHIHPQAYADIALNRSNRVDELELDAAKVYASKFSESEESNYSRDISDWGLSYLFALKIAQLKKSDLLPEKKVEAFIIWMHEETLFSAVASVFAALFLCPTPPNRKMIKGIYSENHKKLHEGIKNAAWDIAYLIYWGSRIKHADKDTTWLLCSNDNAMKRIGKTLYVSAETDERSALTNSLIPDWGFKNANLLAELIISRTTSAMKDPKERDQSLKQRFSAFRKIQLDLEADLKINE